MADDFCQSCLAKEKQAPGPAALLSESEVMTLALFGQWVQFRLVPGQHIEPDPVHNLALRPGGRVEIVVLRA